MTPIEFIQKMRNEYIEKRSDVAELCEDFLLNGTADFSNIEHRYITASVPDCGGLEIQYDTLSTLIEYHKPGEQWDTCIAHEYND
jgi:hypothetical protein